MTNKQLAKALGVAVRTIIRYRAEGLPLPHQGENLATWSKRAKAWRRANRRLPGPRAAKAGTWPSQGAGLARLRELQVQRLELELAERQGKLHSMIQCDAKTLEGLQGFRSSFRQLPDQLARQLYQAPSPDAIKARVTEAVSRIFEALELALGQPRDQPTTRDQGRPGELPVRS